MKETGDTFAAASDIKVYINGEEGGTFARMGDGSLWVMAPDTLTITDGEFNPPKKPVYSVKSVDAVIGEPIKVKELLVTDDPKVTIRSTGIYQGDYWDEYIKYDSKEGTYTPLKAKTSTDVIPLPEEASWAVTFAGPDTFTVKAPIGLPGDGFIGRAVVPIEDGGQESITIGKVLERFPAADACLVELSLLTGRTHQIRVHMSYFGHPLLGDALYGGPTDRIARQALHACSFSCLHPVTGAPLSVSSPLPDDLQRLLEELRH
ncbi:MAG: hypothetical protein IIY82_05995 [Firmicutes bacterium]|nr:hypothetical protein [Bacillota bacterium]